MRADASPTPKAKRLRPRVPSAKIAAALAKSGGIVNVAARIAGCSSSQIRRRLKVEPALREAREEAREEYLDLAESVLMKAVKKGRLGAAIFVLKTLGRSRGYVERQEVETTEGKPLVFYLPKKDPLPDDDEPLETLPTDATGTDGAPTTTH